MHQETLERLCGLVKQQSEGYVEGFTGDLDAGIPPITRFQSVDDVEQIANNLELESGPGLTGTLVEMVGVFYELALNAVEHSEWAAGYYIIRAHSRIAGGIQHTVGIADCGIGIPDSLRRNVETDGEMIKSSLIGSERLAGTVAVVSISVPA